MKGWGEFRHGLLVEFGSGPGGGRRLEEVRWSVELRCKFNIRFNLNCIVLI